jgi:hypothetical protein
VYNFKKRANIKMLENRMLRRMFAPKREEATGGWEKQ